ncbi:MAG: McrB family protein [Chloroflexota bacterium]
MNQTQPGLRGLVDRAVEDFRVAGFVIEPELLHRFVAALMTKRFVILTGQTGSGKTRLAQTFANWITQPSRSAADPFFAGASIPSDRTTYLVHDADRMSIEFLNDPGPGATRVVLPRRLVSEWAQAIISEGFGRETPARTIREFVAQKTRFSAQLNSFETHLKAAAFAEIMAQPAEDAPATRAYRVVPVGADWTTTEHILGYPDALDHGRYVRTPSLDLILRAAANPAAPHFLILDEMNMSHVERYFSDMLSAMESGEPIHLHTGETGAERDGVPSQIALPPNLFIVGTVNVDETTYLFSPKVLDRANTIEFRTHADQLSLFLGNPAALDVRSVAGKGRDFAGPFLYAATTQLTLENPARAMVEQELLLLVRVLEASGHEFGFRTAAEASRFVGAHLLLGGGPAGATRQAIMAAIDAQVYQKILPRMNGTRGSLDAPLRSLRHLCESPHEWSDGPAPRLLNHDRLAAGAVQAAAPRYAGIKEEPPPAGVASAFPASLGKIDRMLRALDHSGFASFAEA